MRDEGHRKCSQTETWPFFLLPKQANKQISAGSVWLFMGLGAMGTMLILQPICEITLLAAYRDGDESTGSG